MVNFQLTFLVSFNLIIPKEPPKKDKGGKSKKSKTSSKKSSKKSDKKSKKSSDKSSKSEKPPPPDHVIPVEKPIGFLHVDYQILPKKSKFEFDVVCWGKIAKVFYQSNVVILKTVVSKDKAWVPICIEHNFEELTIPELLELKSHTIEFNIFDVKKKLGGLAKSDKTKCFYLRKLDVAATKFCKAYLDDPNSSNFQENLSGDSQDTSLNYTKDYDVLLYDFINSTEVPNNNLKFKEFTPNCNAAFLETKTETKSDKSGKTKDKRSKSSQKSKQKQKKNISLLVSGEIFFTDPNYTTYRYKKPIEPDPETKTKKSKTPKNKKTSSKKSSKSSKQSQKEKIEVIKDFFVTINVKKLMTIQQKFRLHPLVIKIKTLKNVPVDELKKHGFSEIYIEYNIPHIAACRTAKQEIRDKVSFNEGHIFFTNCVPNSFLVEFFLTRRFYVVIKGLRDEVPKNKEGVLFGELRTDEDISKINHRAPKMLKEESTDVKLAVVCFDLSSLFRNTWIFKETNQCHVPNVALFQNFSRDDFQFTIQKNTNEMTFMEINEENNQSVLQEHQLIGLGTMLKIEAYFLSTQETNSIVPNFQNTFKRMFVIIFSREKFVHLYKCVFDHNTVVRRENSDDYVSGFMVCNGGDTAFFLEGFACGYILEIWHMIQTWQSTDFKLFIDTTLIFNCRLYPQLANSISLYPILLVESLEKILSKPEVYLKGNIPHPCCQALKKLNIIFHSNTFKIMSQCNLFPTCVELMGLNKEFGVPLKFTKKQKPPCGTSKRASTKVSLF